MPDSSNPSGFSSPGNPSSLSSFSSPGSSEHQPHPSTSYPPSPYPTINGSSPSYSAMNGYNSSVAGYPPPLYPAGSASTPAGTQARSSQLNTSTGNVADIQSAFCMNSEPPAEVNAGVRSVGTGVESVPQLPPSGGYSMNSMNSSHAPTSGGAVNSGALNAAARSISQPSPSSSCINMNAGPSSNSHLTPTNSAVSAGSRNDQQPGNPGCSVSAGAMNNPHYAVRSMDTGDPHYSQGSDGCMSANDMNDQQIAADVLCQLQSAEDHVSAETSASHPSCSHTGTSNSAHFLGPGGMSLRPVRLESSSAAYNYTLQQGVSVKLETNRYHVLSTVDFPSSDKVEQTRQDHPSLPPYKVFLPRSAFHANLPADEGQPSCMMEEESMMPPPPSLANRSCVTRLRQNTSGSQHCSPQAALHRYVSALYLRCFTT